MKRPPSPLETALSARVRLLATTLRPSTVQHYQYTVRVFLHWLDAGFPEVRQPAQLRRDPHLLGFIEHLWRWRIRNSQKPLCNHSRAGHLIRLRKLLDLLADHVHPPCPGLLWSEDIPRPDQLLPRPLSPQDDIRLLAELRGRHDVLSQALLLTRLTGMRIGETADLSSDCLRHLGGDQWALHVPVGKLHNERWTPVDDEVRTILARLMFWRTLPPAAPPPLLLPRPVSRGLLIQQLRLSLRQATAQAGITAHVVPHQLRHYAASRTMPRGSERSGSRPSEYEVWLDTIIRHAA